MKTALDSSLLLAIFNAEDGASDWVDKLIQARKEGLLLICDVVLAEIAPAFEDQRHLESVLETLGVLFDPIEPEAAWKAGQTFKAYRAGGGPRAHLIPDFLIASHAQVQADRLMAIDRGYFRKYFPELKLVSDQSESER